MGDEIRSARHRKGSTKSSFLHPRLQIREQAGNSSSIMVTSAGSATTLTGTSSGSRRDSVVVATPGLNSTSTATSAATPKPSNTWSKSRYDTCGCDWTSGNPRTCSECLGVTLANGESCAITLFGQCMNASEIASLEQFLNFSTIVDSAGNYSVTHPHVNEKFWSTNATYCTTSDATCTSCRANWIRDFQSDRFYSTASLSCVGEDGCICTAYCEIRVSSEITMGKFYDFGEKCALIGNPNGSTSTSSTRSATLVVQQVIGIGLGIVVIIVVVRWGISRFHQKRHDRRMEEQYRALNWQPRAISRFGPMLTLEGWNRHRDQLVASESATLGMNASESQLAEDPVVRVVEAGEGFRPASPSHLSWQRWT